jgi:hypothetical protein
MSCERNPNKIATLACKVGIHRLASKKAFYMGLAAGILALVAGRTIPRLKGMAGKQAGSDARAGAQTGQVGPELITSRKIPALPARTVIRPAAPDVLSGKSCSNCNSPAKSKPGLWYLIDEDVYCQDCAPRAAGEADVDLATPSGPSPTTLPRVATPVEGPKAQGDTMQEILASADPGKVRLQEAPVEVKTADGWVRITGGAYFVYTPDGMGTGLAITPLLKRDGQGGLASDTQKWNITHLKSGMTMAGPYASVEEARRLASILAGIDWRRDVDLISRRELTATRRVVEAYNEALAEVRARSGDRALAGRGRQPADLFGSR